MTQPAQAAPAWQAIRLALVARLGLAVIVASPLLVLLALAFMAWTYAWAVLHMPCTGRFTSLERLGYPTEPVTFSTPEGYSLRGWYSPGQQHPDTAIVVLGGLTTNTEYALADAWILAEAGYSTLVFEHRTCAYPGELSSTGLHEAHDLIGAIDYLEGRPEIAHIGAMGFSVGGTAVMLAAAQDARIEAMVVTGGSAGLLEDTLDSSYPHGWLDWLLRRMIAVSLHLQARESLEAMSPIRVVSTISPRPLLLVYGELEADTGREIAGAAGDNAELWIVPGADHGQYEVLAPEEYHERIGRFFDAAFGTSR